MPHQGFREFAHATLDPLHHALGTFLGHGVNQAQARAWGVGSLVGGLNRGEGHIGAQFTVLDRIGEEPVDDIHCRALEGQLQLRAFFRRGSFSNKLFEFARCLTGGEAIQDLGGVFAEFQ